MTYNAKGIYYELKLDILLFILIGQQDDPFWLVKLFLIGIPAKLVMIVLTFK